MAYQNEQEFTDKKVDFSIWKRLFLYALKNKRLLIKTVIALVVVAGIDVCYPLLTNYAIDNFVTPRTTDGIWWFGALYVMLVFIQGGGTFFFISRTGKMEMAISYDIRQDAYMRLQTLSFSFYDKTAVGYLMARMVSDVARLSEMIAWSIVDVLWAFCFAVGCVVVMFIKNWTLALIVISVIPVLCFVSLFLQKRILKYQRESRRHNSRITGAFNEGIMGAMTTKTLVREDKNAEEFKELTGSMKTATIKASLLSAAFFPLVISLGAIGTSMALSFGGIGVISAGDSFIGFITTGALVAFISYASNLFDPIQQLAHIFAELQSAQASAERVMTLIDTEPAVVDSPEVIAKYGDTMNPKRENWEPLHGDVSFEHVSFAYNEGEPVLSDFNLQVNQGETIALVGETGAGKSTIVNLICRFYEPTQGRILIDGRDYRERSQLWLQSNLGYVLQSPHLFSGSIMDNIRFGRPDATFEQVEHAAKMVHADDFIRAQEHGYDTDVGEGGGRLSIGQKQLISFARVILADPRIFVLDEATSSIDTETEQAIQNAIVNVLKGRTSFIVAHRLSTIRNADRILVVRGGKVVEQGRHEELIELRGYYYDLYMNQYKEGRIQESLRQ
ncbi:MAG: ABC transporter ATP-binding protein [Clostridia bacterium]|nr:ABC transporter ATP-binding protein [Clostridia bacterium]